MGPDAQRGTYILTRSLKVLEVRPHTTLVLFNTPPDRNDVWSLGDPFPDRRGDGAIARGGFAVELAHAGMCSLDAVVRDTNELGTRR